MTSIKGWNDYREKCYDKMIKKGKKWENEKTIILMKENHDLSSGIPDWWSLLQI